MSTNSSHSRVSNTLNYCIWVTSDLLHMNSLQEPPVLREKVSTCRLVHRALWWHCPDHLPCSVSNPTQNLNLANSQSPELPCFSQHPVCSVLHPGTGWEQNHSFIFINFYLKLSISLNYYGRKQTIKVLPLSVTFSLEEISFHNIAALLLQILQGIICSLKLQ